MKRPIDFVQIVSDGIIVRFDDGTLSYFDQGFLRDSIGIGSNQVFLDQNPCREGGNEMDAPLVPSVLVH